VELPSIGENDKEALTHALHHGVDFVAVSYVRTAEDLVPAMELIAEIAPGTPIVAKIEHPSALTHLDSIMDLCGGIMVARGDLGVELPFEEIPIVQEAIIQAALSRGLPVIVATHVLESMVSNSVPTRAEVQDIANSIRQGTHAIMLSGETASGAYPVEAVKVMARVTTHVDQALAKVGHTFPMASGFVANRALANSAVSLAADVDCRRLIVSTGTGVSVMLVSAHRPRTPVTAMTDSVKAMRRTTLLWGVDSVMVEEAPSSLKTIEAAVAKLIADGRLKGGDTLVSATGSPSAIHAPNNTLRLVELSAEGKVILQPSVSVSVSGREGATRARWEAKRSDTNEPGTGGIWNTWYQNAAGERVSGEAPEGKD